MDAFESVVAQIFEAQGYWVRTEVKVELTKEEKIAINRRSSPRWELDVVCYRPNPNEILVVECKSYLDSYGVRSASFDATSRHSDRFKLFVDDALRAVVLKRLAQQWTARGLCRPSPKVSLGLAAGKIYGSREGIREKLEEKGFMLFDPAWIREKLRQFKNADYENQVAIVVAKILSRE
jgi:hypothetical protein